MRWLETAKPILYEINTRVWLEDLSRRAGRAVTLAEVADEEIDRLVEIGADMVWLMGVWQVGPRAVEIARTHAGLNKDYRRVLPDFSVEDVIGSPYSIAEYSADPRLGGTTALFAFRKRLAQRGLGLILDFVSNHTGVDHRWVTQRPELYVQGEPAELEREPGNYFRAATAAGPRIIAHGRDPYFPGWTDTAQLNFLHPAARTSYVHVLQTVADQCDGVRCDMAMLVLSEIFRRTWGERAARTAKPAPAQDEFWAEAIAAVRERHPRFLFIAEAYWGLEFELQRLGFDSTYDKTLYDRLVHGDARGVRGHLQADPEYQRRSMRFIENHDEPRAAAAFPPDRHRAAAVIAATVPGAFLCHEGQLEGATVKLPVQLRRRPPEPVNQALRSFYHRLLAAIRDPAVRQGAWRTLPVRSAWDGNPTWESFVVYSWETRGESLRLVTVNFGHTPGQCYVECGRSTFAGRSVHFADLLGDARYSRDGDELLRKGLYLDMPAFGFHVFDVAAQPKPS